MFARLEGTSDVQELTSLSAAKAAIHRVHGRLQEVLAVCEPAIDGSVMTGIAEQSVKQAIGDAVEAAFALGDADKVEQLLARIEAVPPGTRPPLLDGHLRRFRARIDRDPDGYAAAADIYRRIDAPFWEAVALLELGELTADSGALERAREIFERLGAAPWLERLAAASPAAVSASD
jgi:hypothetical protein